MKRQININGREEVKNVLTQWLVPCDRGKSSSLICTQDLSYHNSSDLKEKKCE